MGIQKGLNLTRESWQVLRQNRTLFLCPLISIIALCGLIAVTLSVGFLVPGTGQWIGNLFGQGPPNQWLHRIAGIVGVFLFYFVTWFVATFCNSVLVGCALMHFKGENPTLKDGFRIAFRRLPQIVAWSAVNAVVGTILKSIEEQLGWLGTFIVRLLGLSWIVATYFVTPILVVEGTGPWKSLRRSVDLLQQTWGEALTGNFVIGGLSWLGGLFVFTVTIGGILLALFFESIAIGVAAGAILVIGLVSITIFSSAMTQVFLAGLYQFASTGQAPQGFSEQSIQQALRSVR
jgi:hypothetical protein